MLKELKFKKSQKINTMNIKMAINSQLSTTESKKNPKQISRNRILGYGDHLEDYQLVGGRGRIGWEGAGTKKYKLVGTK